MMRLTASALQSAYAPTSTWEILDWGQIGLKVFVKNYQAIVSDEQWEDNP